jgi:amino acid adenylation domain-containing protein
MTSTVAAILDAMFADRRDQPAVICGDDRLTYGALDRATAALVGWLDHHHVTPRTTVGLTIERSIAQVAWIVAIVRAGHAFCFLDRNNPAAWNRDVIRRAGIRHVVGSVIEEFGDDLVWIAATPSDAAHVEPIARPLVGPDDPIYVNFSSGTTGAPKVIPCLHRGVIGFCHTPPHFPIGAACRFVYSSPLTFDASQLELWTALLNGGCVVVNDRRHLSADCLRRLVREQGADTLWLTSSLFNALVDVDPDCLAGIRTLMIGGEELSPRHVATLHAANAEITVFNGYGPTETTIVTCVYAIPRGFPIGEPLPIGWPIAHSRIFLVGADGRSCPDGDVGELWIAGAGLSPGYLGDPALTREKYVTLEVEGVSVRCYRSGDLVSRDLAGLLHYHGRIDDQLKIRGNRVILSEIALAFSAHPALRSCTALAVARADEKLIALFYVAGTAPVTPAELAAFGRDRLPDFMIPREFVSVIELPLRSNGKVDRDRLVAAFETGATISALHPEADDVRAPTLRRLAGLPDWTLEASFFEAGGDSLGAIRLIGALDRATGGRLTLEDFYRAPRLRDVLDRFPPEFTPDAGDVTTDETAPLDSLDSVPLHAAQLTMIYPELLHADATRNGVVYLFSRDMPETLDLAPIDAMLRRRFPLLTCRVVEDETGYAFVRATDVAPGIVDGTLEFDDLAACALHWLAVSLPLLAGPLLRLFRCRVASRLHYGVLLHHILGDHLGQLELLRTTEQLLTGDRVACAEPPDTKYVDVNHRLVRRCEAERDVCTAYWESRNMVGTPVRASNGSPLVRRDRWRGGFPDRTPSRQLLRCLAASRAGFEAGFGVREPLVFNLFSLRESDEGLGFQTVLAPLALRDELLPEGRPGPGLLEELLAIRRHAIIGMEDILVAAGLNASDVPFLFNFVDLRPEHHRWIEDHLVDGGAEPARTILDVTVLRAGPILDVTLNGHCEPAQAATFLHAFGAALVDDAG